MEILNTLPNLFTATDTLLNLVGYAGAIFVAVFGILATLLYPA